MIVRQTPSRHHGGGGSALMNDEMKVEGERKKRENILTNVRQLLLPGLPKHKPSETIIMAPVPK